MSDVGFLSLLFECLSKVCGCLCCKACLSKVHGLCPMFMGACLSFIGPCMRFIGAGERSIGACLRVAGA